MDHGSSEEKTDKLVVEDKNSTDAKSSDTKTPGKTGVTGLVRKTSIRRRLSTTEADKPVETFGKKTEDYEKICQSVISDQAVTNAIEALKERWKMLMFMYEDAEDLIKSRKEKISHRKFCEQRRDLFALSIIYASLFLPVFVISLTMFLLFLRIFM